MNAVPFPKQGAVVVFSHAPNPDHPGGYLQHTAAEKPSYLRIVSWREASEACRRYIDDRLLGGGNWTGGDIRLHDINGAVIAHVSYNGRVWRGAHRARYSAADEIPLEPLDDAPHMPATVFQQMLELDESSACSLGLALAKGLGLPRKRATRRFDTNWGDKTEAGLARTLVRLPLNHQSETPLLGEYLSRLLCAALGRIEPECMSFAQIAELSSFISAHFAVVVTHRDMTFTRADVDRWARKIAWSISIGPGSRGGWGDVMQIRKLIEELLKSESYRTKEKA